MKKALLIVSVLAIFYVNKNINGTTLIPDEAIRLRVVANSNSIYDQSIKEKVRDEVQKNMFELLKYTKGIDEARYVIDNNLERIDKSIEKLLKNENYTLGYNVNFSHNYFPEKVYKGVTYNEGYYESVKVTLGEGKGDNWWCVLFPPLCLIEAEESTEVEYKFFLKELIDKYL